MNDTIERCNFCRYFAYDLRRAWYNCGLSAICVGALPLVLYLFCLLFNALGMIKSLPDSTVTASLIPVAYMIYILVFPAKLYGEITVRRAGSNFLMLPASPGCKFASMLLILLLVVPLSIAVLFSASDLMLSLIPSYGHSMFAKTSIINRTIDSVAVFGNGQLISENLLATTTLEQFFNVVLFFTLGAVIFKRKKTGKTILSYLAVVMIIVVVVMIAAKFIPSHTLRIMAENLDLTKWSFIVICHAVNIAVGSLLGFFIYRRLRKIEL